MKRFLTIAVLTALVCAPLRMLYGRLDYSAVPSQMAALAVPAKRYELCTMQMQLPTVEGGNEDAQIWTLSCYDKNDLLLRQITLADGGTEPNYSDYQYNADGKLRSRTVHITDMQIQESNTYDEQGRPLTKRSQTVHTGTNETITDSITTYTYDGSGKGEAVTEVTSGFDSGAERAVVDEEGRVLSNDLSIGEQVYRASYAYDDNGDLLRSTVTTDGQTRENEFRRTYDADGNCIRCETYADGVLTGTEDLTYENGRLRQHRSEDANGNTTVLIYRDVTMG